MFEWLKSLADPHFMPHGHCYLWQPEILWVHVVSDVMIALAYYAIPIILGIFLYKRKQNIPFPEIIGLFVAFIFLCGTTHLIAIYVVWVPLYDIQGWVKAATAVVSILTAIVLLPKLPDLIAIPGIKQAFDQSQHALQEVKEKNNQMQAIYQVAMDREERIVELKEEVNRLLARQNQPKKYSGHKVK